MQTFMPYSDFGKVALVLDDKRLGKQRVEVIQILNALRKPNYGWKNHPAVRMWDGYEFMLCDYGIRMCNEWIRRGFNDTCREKLLTISHEVYFGRVHEGGPMGSPKCWTHSPPWVNDARVHLSHQSNLVRKYPEHYRKHFPYVADSLPYFWPSHHAQKAA